MHGLQPARVRVCACAQVLASYFLLLPLREEAALTLGTCALDLGYDDDVCQPRPALAWPARPVLACVLCTPTEMHVCGLGT